MMLFIYLRSCCSCLFGKNFKTFKERTNEVVLVNIFSQDSQKPKITENKKTKDSTEINHSETINEFPSCCEKT